MLRPLNPALYEELQRRFGVVITANAGERAGVSYLPGPQGRKQAVVRGGEYYRVNCPGCGDLHQHLWVSYLFGTWDYQLQNTLDHVAFCYRCSNEDVARQVRRSLRPSFGQRRLETMPLPPRDEDAAAARALVEINLPSGRFMFVHHLEDNHPARRYLESRGYDVVELGTRYGWMCCLDSPHGKIRRRLFFPMFHEAERLSLVGYQTRAVPGWSPEQLPKYWTMPDLPRSRLLYNLHRARHHDLMVLCEGVMDAARVGDAAMALLGRKLSGGQLQLLLERCAHARLAVLLDGDAVTIAHNIVERLNSGTSYGRGLVRGAFLVPLAEGDPGSHSREELWTLIQDYEKNSHVAGYVRGL